MKHRNKDDFDAFNQQLDEMWKSGDPDQLAVVAASLMLSMSYWHEKAKLHALLHPLFFLAGFVSCYFLVK